MAIAVAVGVAVTVMRYELPLWYKVVKNHQMRISFRVCVCVCNCIAHKLCMRQTVFIIERCFFFQMRNQNGSGFSGAKKCALHTNKQ